MASLLRSNLSRPHLLQLSPAIRWRPFSSTAPRKYFIADVILAAPIAILDAVHGIGLPWCVAIPATAVFVRCTFGYYLAALPARKCAIIRTHLTPLVSNLANYDASVALRRSRNADDRVGKVKREMEIKLKFGAYKMWYGLRANYRMGKKFKAPLVPLASLLNFGMLVMFAGAIRVKCGHGAGNMHALDASSRHLPADGTDQLMAERMEAAQAAADVQAELYASGTGDVVVDPQLLDPAHHFELMGQTAKTYSDTLDPTMLVEGLSWAQNLAVPDSTYILPALLGLTILSGAFKRDAYTIAKSRRRIENEAPPSGTIRETEIMSARTNEVNAAFARADQVREEGEAQKQRGVMLSSWTFAQKFKLWTAGIFFLLASGMPTGILLYMIPSVAIGQLHSRWLDYKHPMPAPILPCQRPLRFKARKQFQSL